MKTLKFANNLPKLILKGEKNITWRLNDDKNLNIGDEISLLRAESKEEFAKAIILSVKETTFGELTEEDWKGHEKFQSNEEMYRTYSKYYSIDVNSKTKLKIINFKLK